jgi:hypothetical protein
MYCVKLLLRCSPTYSTFSSLRLISFLLSRRRKLPSRSRGDFVQGEAEERWKRLCEQASVEQDPEKLVELVREINHLLEEKHKRSKMKNILESGIDEFSAQEG